MMNLVWVAILALGAGPDGRPAVAARGDHRPAAVHPAPADPPRIARSIAGPRRAGRRPFACPWTISGPDESDTEEVDETWVLHLDAAGSTDLAWPGWGPPRDGFGAVRIAAPARCRLRHFPLRC